jgi:hypothetical protein
METIAPRQAYVLRWDASDTDAITAVGSSTGPTPRTSPGHDSILAVKDSKKTVPNAEPAAKTEMIGTEKSSASGTKALLALDRASAVYPTPIAALNTVGGVYHLRTSSKSFVKLS